MSESEHHRFVKLAFCRADLLFELDRAGLVRFAAGATEALFGRSPDKLVGQPFIDRIAKPDREALAAALSAVGPAARIDDRPVRLAGRAGTLGAVLAGYRAVDFGDHFFLAIKVDHPASQTETAPSAAPSADGGFEASSFGRLAAERVAEVKAAGHQAQLTLFRIDNLDGVLRGLGASAKSKLLGVIDAVLHKYALGGDATGQLDERGYCLVHDETVNGETVSAELVKAAAPLVPTGTALRAEATTLDADGGGLSETQVARAIAHSLQTFCAKGPAGLGGRRLTEVFDDLMRETVGTVSVIRDIAARGEIDLVFMPVCDLRQGLVHHFEALARFRDPRHAGSPFALIALAEEVDIVHDLDLAICTRAMSAIAAFGGERFLPPVAVNLSGKSLANPTFVRTLHDLLERRGIGPEALQFELTESAKVADLDTVNRHMQSFRAKGYVFALDDFGAGAASFDYLNLLDADMVKFDGPVVRRACATAKGNELLATMTKMCANQRIVTVAEMVEDKKMANQIYYCGVDLGQGWYFGKPTDDPFAFAERFATLAAAESD